MPEYNAENTDFPIGVTLVNIAKGTLSSSPHRLMSEQSTIRYSEFSGVVVRGRTLEILRRSRLCLISGLQEKHGHVPFMLAAKWM